MKYIGSRNYDADHIRDAYVPFRMMKDVDICSFVYIMAREGSAKGFRVKCADGTCLEYSGLEGLGVWQSHYIDAPVKVDAAVFEFGEHSLQVIFSFLAEIVVVREKSDANSYLKLLNSAEMGSHEASK